MAFGSLVRGSLAAAERKMENGSEEVVVVEEA